MDLWTYQPMLTYGPVDLWTYGPVGHRRRSPDLRQVHGSMDLSAHADLWTCGPVDLPFLYLLYRLSC